MLQTRGRIATSKCGRAHDNASAPASHQIRFGSGRRLPTVARSKQAIHDGGEEMRQRKAFISIAAFITAAAVSSLASAQATNPRFGRWKLKQDPPATNIMTYEPYGNGGMKITVENTNAVRKIDQHTNEITNKRGGKVIQVITNVLSADGNTINNTYKNYDEKGDLTSTTTAVYERIK
jgi:hypothetical protein